jgi:hypothetical protein
MSWTTDPDAIACLLEEAGFDVDRSAQELIGGGSLTARRDRADRTTLLVVDAGGRLRIDLTSRLSERTAPATLGGLSLHGVESTVRSRTLTGRLTAGTDLVRLLAELDELAGSEESEAPSADLAERRDGPW